VIRLEEADGGQQGVRRASDAGTVTPAGRGDESKRHVEPDQLS
jgi:hypothetical protein